MSNSNNNRHRQICYSICSPNLSVRGKETTNTAINCSQFEWPTCLHRKWIHFNVVPFPIHFTCGLPESFFFFFYKNWHKCLLFHWGPVGGSLQSHAGRETEKRSSSPICCRFPWGEKQCWFWHTLHRPKQQILPFFFFETCWLRISVENWGKKKKKRKEKKERERVKTAPGLEGDIVCMCTQAQGLWPAAYFFFLWSQDYPQSQ